MTYFGMWILPCVLPASSKWSNEKHIDRSCRPHAAILVRFPRFSPGPKAVAELLRRHPKRYELQRRGLRALRDLAYKGVCRNYLANTVL